MSNGPLMGISGALKALRDLFPTDTLTKINRLDQTIGSRLSDATGAKQAELTAVKATVDLNLDAKISTIKSRLQSEIFESSNGSWTIPTGVEVVYVTMVGGGGGGGGAGRHGSDTSSVGQAGGGGGGSQGVIRYPLFVKDDTTLNIQVGGGGAIGVGAVDPSTSGTDGGQGSASSVTGNQTGIKVRVLGGAKGNNGAAASSTANPSGTRPSADSHERNVLTGNFFFGVEGGKGGNGSVTGSSEDGTGGDDVAGMNGGSRGDNNVGGTSNDGSGGGGGGASVLGEGGKGGDGNSNANGSPGAAPLVGYGGGGGGGGSSYGIVRPGANGGLGADGVVILEY